MLLLSAILQLMLSFVLHYQHTSPEMIVPYAVLVGICGALFTAALNAGIRGGVDSSARRSRSTGSRRRSTST